MTHVSTEDLLAKFDFKINFALNDLLFPEKQSDKTRQVQGDGKSKMLGHHQ